MVLHTNPSVLILSFLTLTLTLTLQVQSQPDPQYNYPRPNVRWLDPQRIALIRLETPDLPLWNKTEHVGEDLPSSLMAIIRILSDNSTLLFQNIPILPLQNPHRPPPLTFAQSGASLRDFHRDDFNIRKLATAPTVDVDYERLVEPRDDWSVPYLSYDPEVMIDVLGAGIEGNNALLKSKYQHTLKIKLRNQHAVYEVGQKNNFVIEDISLQERGDDYQYPALMETGGRECSLWSWRCEDFNVEPWYIFVLRSNFDNFGRIGSLRREVLMRWEPIRAKTGVVYMILAGIGLVWVLSYIYVLAVLLVKKARSCVEIGMRAWSARGKGGKYVSLLRYGEDSDDYLSDEELDEKVPVEREADFGPYKSAMHKSRYRRYRD